MIELHEGHEVRLPHEVREGHEIRLFQLRFRYNMKISFIRNFRIDLVVHGYQIRPKGYSTKKEYL